MWERLKAGAKAIVHSLYISVRRRHWQAASPLGTIPLGFLTDAAALKAGHALGRVGYVDLERAVVFYDIELSHNTGELKK